MKYRALWFTLLVLGCGAKEPVKSAANAETSAPSTEAQKEAAPTPAATPAAATKPEPSAAPAGPASPEDMREVLQAVIDDEALTPYLHLEQRGRFPLRVSAKGLPQGIQLTKMTKPVVLVDDAGADPKKPLFVFTEIEIKGGEATVRFKYDIEGVRGFATLNKPYGHWAIKQSRVNEH
jgi:hypothetical protein